jgi:hypothetical protein
MFYIFLISKICFFSKKNMFGVDARVTSPSCWQSLGKELVCLSPLANYTYRGTAACRRSYCQLMRIEGVIWSAQRDPHGRNLGSLDRSRYFSFQVAPQLYSRGWVDPVPDPLLLRKSGIAGNRTRTSGSVARKLWPLDHRGGLLSSA